MFEVWVTILHLRFLTMSLAHGRVMWLRVRAYRRVSVLGSFVAFFFRRLFFWRKKKGIYIVVEYTCTVELLQQFFMENKKKAVSQKTTDVLLGVKIYGIPSHLRDCTTNYRDFCFCKKLAKNRLYWSCEYILIQQENLDPPLTDLATSGLLLLSGNY